ncbi:FG-GAP repeat protein [Candidatus Uhrbacteria bacterium]|nr:FG-GAP repeat protein [Candidatus Uhrbacteria bacterium]
MRRSWKSTVGLLVISYWLLVIGPAYALPDIKPTFPRLANYFLHWTISEEEARELAKWDLLILDMEVQYRSPEALKIIRQLNPAIIILAYLTPVEIRDDADKLKEAAPLRNRLLTRYLREDWYLLDTARNRRSFWPGTDIINITASAPAFEGRRWADVLPIFVRDEIIRSGLWDGVFYDNGWGDPSHHTGVGVDLDRDGNAESPEEVNRLWKQGMTTLFENTQQALQGRSLVMVNGNGADYAPDVHGVLFEYFPREGWPLTMSRYVQSIKDNLAPPLAAINRISENGQPDDYRGLRFGLASALLADGYYSFDYGVLDHGQVWRYDEYGAFLGEPLAPPRSYDKQRPFAEGLWRRDFEKGLVLLNSGKVSRTVSLPVEVEKLRGPQDPKINDGAIVRSVTLAGQDGLIVLRPLQVIVGAPFENGVFARVFDARGEPVRAGFFAFDKRERSGATIAVVDVDGDGKEERVRKSQITNHKSQVEIFFGDGRISRFEPFPRWEGEVQFDIGDVNRDGVLEIVAAMGTTPHPGPLPQGERGRIDVSTQVRVFRPDGTLLTLSFFPFGPNYRGGANVAVGDLNKDGFSEIVVGAGPGGGPQVRIFNGEGKLLSGGFFAYDPRFRGGVRVAAGDTDGDGSAEIITGPGPGGGPQVRLFDGKGRALSPGFFAFDRASRVGAIPIVTDIDGDGRPEILAVTREIL